ncbi:FUSC family protein [Plantactinospora sp. KLBMP9567]|uniref:FUSC family protein n=1 Tax=Plantactinospora sp. KLBMP9567 TaxID=3085900 RepID=UPI0029813C34|nr:FUSC family protein [Plantactinospora sp. KLBMP9567]MDW5329258.1 FUSC family protein [Plantactinospora sp. KLBMP9567]
MPPRPHYRSPLVAAVRRLRETAGRARYEGRRATQLRARQLEVIAVIAVQAGIAAGLSWWIAHNLLGNPNPVFAPTAAVGTIVAAIGQRTRRTVELLAGVGLGIVIGDLLIFLIGSGAWQTAVIVTLAIGVALGLVGRGGTIVSQVGGTAVLIATLSSSERNLEIPRIVDAVTGSAVGLVVVALLLPLNPIRVVNRAAGPVFAILVGRLQDIGVALRKRDAERAIRALDGLRGIEQDLGRLREAVSGAAEVVRLAPLRWGRRQEFEHYARGVTELTRVIEGARDLARRAVTVIDYREPIPGSLPDAIEMLASAVRELHRQARTGRDTGATRRRALVAARRGGRARREGLHNFGDALVTQLRVSAADVVRATGCPSRQAARAVRRAARNGERARPPYDDAR